MPRHSFIQMTKLHNVMGRIDYITSTVKQENLYAIYATQPLRSFWKDLAKCNREEFAKSGTIGKYIEARELIIALPEGLYHYEHDYLIKHFATDFKKKYGVDCYAALHHNKRKTNFHIHLIFAERTKLEKPVVKVASRNMFYDERGKHVRTKKEILDASGDIRNGCKIIRKGEVYEKKEFSIKVDRFKKDSFLDEAKVFFTNEINQLVLHEEDKLKVFDKNSPYFATKKIGKNNPMEEQIKADNEVRQEWNRTVDRAIVSGVSEEDISRIKKNEITEKVRYSIDLYGDRTDLLASIIKLAIAVLELLINRIMLAAVGVAEKMLDIVPEESRNIEAKTYPTMPTMSPLAKKYLTEKLLVFMQERWNLQFDEEQLEKLIGISFVKDGREIPEELEEVSVNVPESEESAEGSGDDQKLQFWTAFVNYANEHGRSSDIAKQKAAGRTYYDVHIGANGYHLFFSIPYGKRIKMGIYTYNVDTYNRLKELKDQIETEFGENLNWEYSKLTGTTRSIVIEEKADVFNPAEQPKIFDWIIDHFDRITTALSMTGEHLSISGDSSETRFEIRKRYWTYALTQIHEAHGNPGSFSNVNPSTDNWINGFFGIGGFYLCCVANFDSARSEVVFARAERSENKAAFDALYQHKSEIESKLGTELQWNRGDDIKSSKVFIQLDNVSIENEDDWPQMAKFHAEWSKKFYDLIVPYITVDWQ